jgi:hypothetical protein
LLFCFLCSGVNAYDELTPEEWQEFMDTHYTGLVEYRDSLEIPKDEPFTSGEEGITWEKFSNLPRRALTGDEVAELKEAAEQRTNDMEYGIAGGDLFGGTSGTNNFDYSSALFGDILLVHEGTVPWGYFRHIGMFDRGRYDANQWPILEAMPNYGVHFAPISQFVTYDQQVGLKPHPGYGYVAYSAHMHALMHLGQTLFL